MSPRARGGREAPRLPVVSQGSRAPLRMSREPLDLPQALGSPYDTGGLTGATGPPPGLPRGPGHPRESAVLQ